MNYQTANIFV